MSEWIMTEDGVEYKDITTNGAWEIIRFRGDLALYSFCPYCGHTHPCYKEDRGENGEFLFKVVYAPEKEYNFCPKCGTQMLEGLDENYERT